MKITNIVILLTCTVNPHLTIKKRIKQNNSLQRLQIYNNIIQKWLKKTKFKIVIVENSGHYFKIKHPRAEIISFHDNSIKIDKGIYEARSVLHAYKHSSFIQNNDCHYLVKITGRYFLPELQDYFQNLQNTKGVDLILQKKIRSEIVCCKKHLVSKIFNPKLYFIIEVVIRIRSLTYQKKYFPIFSVSSVRNGKHNKIVKYI